MICMAALAPKGIFEEDEREAFDFNVCEEPRERHYDDYSRNCEDAA